MTNPHIYLHVLTLGYNPEHVKKKYSYLHQLLLCSNLYKKSR